MIGTWEGSDPKTLWRLVKVVTARTIVRGKANAGAEVEA